MRPFSIGERRTPCIPAVSAGGSLLWFKLELCNPTGSYKDRFASRFVAAAIARGARSLIATSSGNTGAALAACCARAELRCLVVSSPEAPPGKVAQMRSHGATVVLVPGFTTQTGVTAQVLGGLRQFCAGTGVPLAISAFRYCPDAMLGVGDIADEIAHLEPDHVFVPVGGGGLLSAIAERFLSRGGRAPRVHAVQPEGCPTLLLAAREGRDAASEVTSTTRISGLSVPTDIDATRALKAVQRTKGTAIGVTDEEIWSAQGRLLSREGIYCEPAGATAFAGWRKAVSGGTADPGEKSVCIVTGHGFKDPDSIQLAASKSSHPTIEASALTEFLEREVTSC